jgi:Tfp pilus assembly protein PilF
MFKPSRSVVVPLNCSASDRRNSRSAAADVRRRAWLTLVGTYSILVGLCCTVHVGWSVAAPFTPPDDDLVLERLAASSMAKQTRELRRQWQAAPNDPEQLQSAVETARRFIEQSRAESDPRFLGYAQAALARWWNAADAPAQVLVLRATIRQSQHDFTGALADLDAALGLEPTNAQAWLTKAIVHEVRGEHNEAKRCLRPLARLAPGLVTATCVASLASLTGEAERAYETLRFTLARHRDEPENVRLWAMTVLAEIAARLGRAAEAEEHFRQALALGRRDGYLLGAYADFLLDHARADEAIHLLKDETHADGLLLRLAEAEKGHRSKVTGQSLGLPEEGSGAGGRGSTQAHQRGADVAVRPPDRVFLRGTVSEKEDAWPDHVATLEKRFAASRRRGDSVHRREEARFTLRLLGEAKEALRLAKENWQVQREPADVRILLECAIVAKDSATVRWVRDWLKGTRLEDVQLAKRLEEWQALAVADSKP